MNIVATIAKVMFLLLSIIIPFYWLGIAKIHTFYLLTKLFARKPTNLHTFYHIVMLGCITS